MPDQNQVIEPEQHEVNIPVMQKGDVRVFTKEGFSNPAPDKLKRVLSAIKWTFVSLITMISGSDLFSGKQSKITCFCLGVGIIICGAIELGVGVKPLPDDNK